MKYLLEIDILIYALDKNTMAKAKISFYEYVQKWPYQRDVINDTKGQIQEVFTKAELEELVAVLEEKDIFLIDQ